MTDFLNEQFTAIAIVATLMVIYLVVYVWVESIKEHCKKDNGENTDYEKNA